MSPMCCSPLMAHLYEVMKGAKLQMGVSNNCFLLVINLVLASRGERTRCQGHNLTLHAFLTDRVICLGLPKTALFIRLPQHSTLPQSVPLSILLKTAEVCFSTAVQISNRVLFYLALPSLIASKYPIYNARCVLTPCHPIRTRAFSSTTWSTRWHWQLICKHWQPLWIILHNYSHSIKNIHCKMYFYYKNVVTLNFTDHISVKPILVKKNKCVMCLLIWF